MKRFKASSSLATGVVSSMATSINYTQSPATLAKTHSSGKDSVNFSNYSQTSSFAASSGDMSEKRKRGRPKGSFTSNKR